MNKDLIKAVRHYGDLVLKISGRGIVVFNSPAGKLTGTTQIFEGSNGCIKPKEEGSKTALEYSFDYIKSLDIEFIKPEDKPEDLNMEETIDLAINEVKEFFNKNEELTSFSISLETDKIKFLDLEFNIITNAKIASEYEKIIKGDYLGKVTEVRFEEVNEEDEEDGGQLFYSRFFITVKKGETYKEYNVRDSLIIPGWITTNGMLVDDGDYLYLDNNGYYHTISGNMYTK